MHTTDLQSATTIFTMGVSSAVLVHELLVCVGYVSLRIAIFLSAEFCCCHFKNQEIVRFHQYSIGIHPLKPDFLMKFSPIRNVQIQLVNSQNPSIKAC